MPTSRAASGGLPVGAARASVDPPNAVDESEPSMPLNQALLGKEYPPVRYEVGREKLREFAESVGETDPVYHDEEAARAAGHPDIPAVPTFPIVLSRRVGQKVYEDPDLGLDYSRVVHGEQEFTYHRPIFAGDRLLAAGRVAAVQVRGRHELLAIETVVTTEEGEPVCSATVTLIARGTAPAATGPAATPEPGTAPGPAGGSA
jgi:acyl dehydratase